MTARQPLTREERHALTVLYRDGHESMITSFGDIYAYPMSKSSADEEPLELDGAVWLPKFEDDDSRSLTPDQARLLAVNLLQAADHVEFGPGEWTASGEWVRIQIQVDE